MGSHIDKINNYFSGVFKVLSLLPKFDFFFFFHILTSNHFNIFKTFFFTHALFRNCSFEFEDKIIPKLFQVLNNF